MGIPDYLRVLWHRRLIVTMCTFLAAAAAGVLTSQTTPLYAGTVTLFISAPDTGTGSGAASAYQAGLLSQQRVRSYAELLRSRPMVEQLIRDIGGGIDPEALRERIEVQTVPDSVLLRAIVTDPSPDRAAQIAKSLGSGFGRLVTELERSTAQGTSPIRVTMVGEPEVSPDPVSPRPAQNLAVGGLLGLVLGVGLALLRDAMDTSVRSVEQTREITRSPTLGVIRFDRATPSKPLLSHIGPHSPRAEAFRTLRTNLRFLDVDRPIQTLLLTSCHSGEGKSTTACNLALSLAEAGTRVAVVDSDLRRPRLAEYLGIEGAVGLTSVLIGQARLDDVLQPWGRDGLLVLPSGPIPPNPAELLGSQHMQSILAELSAKVDIVLIDAPPLLPVTDASVLSRLCDGVLLVVRHAKTSRDQLQLATDQLETVGGRLLGHVLSMAPATRSVQYGYGNVYAQQQRMPEEQLSVSGL